MSMLNKSLASAKTAHKVIELWWWNILMSWALDLWEQNQQQFTQMGKLCMSEKYQMVFLGLDFSVNKREAIIL